MQTQNCCLKNFAEVIAIQKNLYNKNKQAYSMALLVIHALFIQ